MAKSKSPKVSKDYLTFDLKKPCQDCLLLKDKPIILSEERIRDIAESALEDDQINFPCHKTNLNSKASKNCFCYGMMSFLAKNDRPNIAMRIAMVYGKIDYEEMKNNPLICATVEEAMQSQNQSRK